MPVSTPTGMSSTPQGDSIAPNTNMIARKTVTVMATRKATNEQVAGEDVDDPQRCREHRVVIRRFHLIAPMTG